MISTDFMSDADCFKTYASLREKIYYKKKIASRNIATINKTYQLAKNKKSSISLADFKNDKSVIIAIQNDVRFINMIMNCRKQRSPIAYIFVESNLYISCIIKNINGYPLMFIRIPIDGVYTYANNTNNTYEFPIQGLLSKDIKYTKNSSYTMIFKYDGQNVNFIYELYNGDLEPNRVIINSIGTNNQSIINEIFKNNRNDGFMSGIILPIKSISELSNQDNNNYLLSFYNMNIIILREVQDTNTIIQFNQKQSPKVSNYFEIKSERMDFITETSKNHNEKYICSINDSIIWPKMWGDEVKRYDMMPFESLFKINYNKSITTNDKVYYAFTSYLDNYMFIKIISPFDITNNLNTESFIKIFSKEYQILECYLCVKYQDV